MSSPSARRSQLRPRATLGEYRGLEVGRAEPEVPEGAVDAELDRLRDQVARLEPVERRGRRPATS